MSSFLHDKQGSLLRKGNCIFLAFFWISGLISGMLSCYFADISIASMMRSTIECTVSISGLLCVTILPFLFSAFAVFLSQLWLLLPICFLKALLFSYILFGVVQAWHNAAWLVAGLLLFSECVSAPMFYYFLRRSILTEGKISFAEFLLHFSVLLLISSIDYCIISPFLACIIDF